MPALLPSAISLLRPVLGLYVLSGAVSTSSTVPLLIVAVACVSDFVDGRVARAIDRGRAPALGVDEGAAAKHADRWENYAGRLVDNLCDFGFLLCMFLFYAGAELWSPPVWGNLLRHWDGVNRVPVYALLASFGIYFARLCMDLRAARKPEGSPRGHAAGVANYGLAILGALEMLPDVDLGPRLLESAMLGVALLNAAAVLENAALMFHRQRGGPTMPA
ncbi:MAG TPA: CDP-alcohol phosphatidyltransferase family protein [Candidatus Limnocylindrales bacterium]|nr:CDP-alcohol phosphatidyltransferase family protein [Candidatus Limnocylindrales bacterium]